MIVSKYCPWLSERTKLLVRERNKAQELFSENKTDENFSKYKILRNKVTSNLRADKVKWQKEKWEKCNNDPGKLWKNILGWLNWCSSGSPTKLYHADQIVTSPAKLAEIMNNFFVSKIATIREALPNQTEEFSQNSKKYHEREKFQVFSVLCSPRYCEENNTCFEE